MSGGDICGDDICGGGDIAPPRLGGACTVCASGSAERFTDGGAPGGPAGGAPAGRGGGIGIAPMPPTIVLANALGGLFAAPACTGPALGRGTGGGGGFDVGFGGPPAAGGAPPAFAASATGLTISIVPLKRAPC